MKVLRTNKEFLGHCNELYRCPGGIYHIRFREGTVHRAGSVHRRSKRSYMWAIAAMAVIASMILPMEERRAGEAAATNTRMSYTVDRRLYTVQRGDTLWDIAERFMGYGMGYHIIVYENQLVNPDLIFPNDVLVVPVIQWGNN